MWQGIQVITNYKTTSSACDSDASLPDALNDFYAWFEAENNVVVSKTIPPPNDQVLCLSTPDMKRTLHSSNHIIKFADDTTVVGLISNDESTYREDVQGLTAWCKANNLSLNVDKTKQMAVDFRRAQSGHSPLFIDGSSVEIIKSTKFLGVHPAENFTWSLNTSSFSKSLFLYFLQRLRKAHLPPPILTMFYRGTIESVLSSCITAWFGNCLDHKTLQRVVRTAEKIIGVSLPSITDMYTTRCIRKANSVLWMTAHTPHTHSPPSCHLER
ncbi:hypothetical protein QTP70_014707, partial [Hemibagrus guttatus]